MKINFIRDDSQKLSGYENINISTGAFMSIMLDQIVEDAEASDIRAVDVIDYFPSKDTSKVLNYWIKKLKHGGELSLVSTDCLEVSRGLVYNKLNIDNASDLLYGQESDSDTRKTSLTLNQVADYLKSKGLVIESARVHNYRFVIKARRP